MAAAMTPEKFAKTIGTMLGRDATVEIAGPLYKGYVVMPEESMFYRYKVIYRMNMNNAQVVIMFKGSAKNDFELTKYVDKEFSKEFKTSYNMKQVQDARKGHEHLVIEIESAQDPNLHAFINNTYQAMKKIDDFYLADQTVDQDDQEDVAAPAAAIAPAAPTNYKIIVAGQKVASFAAMAGGAKDETKSAAAAPIEEKKAAPITEIKDLSEVFKNNISAGKNKVQAAKDEVEKANKAVAAAEKALADAKAAQVAAEKKAATVESEFGNMRATIKAQMEVITALMADAFGVEPTPAAAAAPAAAAVDEEFPPLAADKNLIAAN